MSATSRRRRQSQPPPPRDRTWADYAEAFRNEVWPHLVSAAVFVSVAEDWADQELTGDAVQAATDIGMAVMIGRPLLVIVPVGISLHPRLRAVATMVLDDVDMGTEEAQQRIIAALAQLKGEA